MINSDKHTKIPTSILIIRLSSFGDILLTFPLIHLLSKNFPDIKIDFLVDKNFKDVFVPIKNYNVNLILFDKSKGFSEAIKYRKVVKQNKYDLIVDLQNNLRSFILAKGLSTELYKFKKHRIRRYLFVKWKLKVFSQKMVSEKYIDSLKGKIFTESGDKIKTEISKELVLKLQKDYPFIEGNKKNLIIYPGAKHFTKKWPIKYYDELIKKIVETGDWQVILSGDKADAADIEKMNYLNLPSVRNVAGKLSIEETITLTSLCDFVISNDSAPMHIATLFEKPQISIWGNTVTDFGFAPISEKSVIIENKDLKCRPCSHIGFKECPENHFKCMKDISVESVFKSFMNMANSYLKQV